LEDEVTARPSKYPNELRQRAVRRVIESKGDYGSQFEAITSNSRKPIDEARKVLSLPPGEGTGCVLGFSQRVQGGQRGLSE